MMSIAAAHFGTGRISPKHRKAPEQQRTSRRCRRIARRRGPARPWSGDGRHGHRTWRTQPLPLRHVLAELVCRDGRERPAQVAVAGVVEHVGQSARTHARHHVRHHGPQAGPGFHPARAHAGETLVHPVHQRPDAVGADVQVDAVELGRAGHAEAVHTEAAGHQLGLVVQQAHLRRGGLALFVVEHHGDGVALDRVHVEPVAELGAERAAVHAGADHHGVGVHHLPVVQRHLRGGTGAAHAGHRLAGHELHAQARAGLAQAVGELVDVAGAVALGVVATEVVAPQRGLDGAHLLGRDGTARQAALGQQPGHLPRVLEAGAVAVDVQDALLLQVEIDPFGFNPAEQPMYSALIP
eukprot:Opistho-1_new@71843